MISSISTSYLLRINLVLGVLIAISNGAALMLALSGKADSLSSQSPEIATWFVAGVLLVITAGYAIYRAEKAAVLLVVQTYLIAGLVIALSAWALFLVTGATSSSARAVWTVGYLTGLGLYCYVLASRAFPGPSHAVRRNFFAWLLVPGCIAIDLLTFFKLS
jgi:hypothetical protein